MAGAGMGTMLHTAYLEIPPVTRFYTTLCVLTTVAVQMEIVTPLQLYFHPQLIMKSFQFWRLITTFLFLGYFSLNFFLNIAFTYRFCRLLEENSFRGRTADLVFMFLFGGVLMIIFALFSNPLFLGHAFTIMIVYVWARRNPSIRLNLFGLLTFQAPYYPWVMLAFSILLGASVTVELLGVAIGHLYYFLEDVFPNQPGGWRILETPMFLKMIFDPVTEDPAYQPMPEDRPGGFNWGAGGEGAGAEEHQNAADRRQRPHEHQD